jgi:hypothetical protein
MIPGIAAFPPLIHSIEPSIQASVTQMIGNCLIIRGQTFGRLIFDSRMLNQNSF